ncbi:MAG: hypothetical protein AAB686_03360, partial [Patescibacteria group bacterium]
MFSKIIKSSFLLILIAVLSVAGIVSYHFRSVEAQSVEYDIAGWLWSDAYGWISLTSDNTCAVNNNCETDVDYGIKIDSQDKIIGYGWSENAGWICFGSTCQNQGDTPESSVPVAEFNPDSGQIAGWAKVISLAGDDGWIHLRRNATNNFNPPLSGEACYDCDPACDQWNQSCDAQGGNCVNTTCKKYSENEFRVCKTCFTRTKFDNTNYPEDAVSGDFVPGGNEYVCGNCGSDSNRCVKSGIGDSKRIVCGNSCSSCEIYGVARDSGSGSLVGWGWGGVEASGVKGAGWVHFNPLQGGGFIVYPWLETKYGAIYTPTDVKQRAQSVGVNATYCIFANSVWHINSKNCLDVVKNVLLG